MNHKKIAVLFLTVICLLTFTGCHLAKLNEERDMAQVVARVNGVEITKGDVYTAVESSYSQYSYQFSTLSEEAKRMMYTYALEDLISAEVRKQKAFELGMDKLDDAKKAEVEKELNDYFDNLRKQITVPDDVQDKEAYIQNEIESQIQSAGLTMDEFRQMFYSAAAVDALTDSVRNATPKPTEEEVKKLYDNLLEYQKYVYEQPFTEDEESKAVQDLFAGTELAPETLATTVYTEGAVVIYHPKEEHRQGIYIKLDYSTELENEFTTVNKNKELTDEQKQEKLKALYEKAGTEVTEDLKAITTSIQADSSKENFEKLIEEYTDDTDHINYLKFGGYVLHKEEKGYEEALRKALFGLKEPGEISEPVYSETGCYIVMLTKIFTPGIVKPYDEVYDQLVDYKYKSMQDEAWDNKVAEWTKEVKLEKYESRLFN